MLLSKNNRRFKNKTKAEINITPMVDVMTVLMAVFMITAPLLTSGVDVDLPQGGKTSLQGKGITIDIAVNKKGEIFIGKSKIPSVDAVKAKLQAMMKENPESSIVISGDKNTNYGYIVSLMAKLKDAGYSKVGLKTSFNAN